MPDITWEDMGLYFASKPRSGVAFRLKRVGPSARNWRLSIEGDFDSRYFISGQIFYLGPDFEAAKIEARKVVEDYEYWLSQLQPSPKPDLRAVNLATFFFKNREDVVRSGRAYSNVDYEIANILLDNWDWIKEIVDGKSS